MTPAHLTKVWTAVGALLTYYTLSAWTASQGGPTLFRQIFFPDAARIESLFALIVCAPLLTLLALIGVAHARAVGRIDWAGRLPVVWLEGLDMTRPSARAYQGFFLGVFILMPAAGLVHFLQRFAKATVIDRHGLEPPFPPFCLLDCPAAKRDRYLVGDGLTVLNVDDPEVLKASVDWLPHWEQWVILGLVAAALVSAAVLVWQVFRFSLRPGRGG